VTERLTEPEIEALAAAYADSGAAAAALERAGMARQHQPRPAGDAMTFWSEVNAELSAGRLVDGRWHVLRIAAQDYPGNKIFRSGLTVTDPPAADPGPPPRTGERRGPDESQSQSQSQSQAMVINASGSNLIFGGQQGTVIGTAAAPPPRLNAIGVAIVSAPASPTPPSSRPRGRLGGAVREGPALGLLPCKSSELTGPVRGLKARMLGRLPVGLR
jgi:hypothetical protein